MEKIKIIKIQTGKETHTEAKHVGSTVLLRE